jgi:hypothetical protein
VRGKTAPSQSALLIVTGLQCVKLVFKLLTP